MCRKKVSKNFLMSFYPVYKKPHQISRPGICRKQVAAILCYLADEERIRKISNLFGIVKSTMSKVIRCATQALSKYLRNKHIVLPPKQKELEHYKIFIRLMAFHSVLVQWIVHMLILKSRSIMQMIKST